MYINIYLKKLTVMRGNTFQIAQNQTNVRENKWQRVW